MTGIQHTLQVAAPLAVPPAPMPALAGGAVAPAHAMAALNEDAELKSKCEDVKDMAPDGGADFAANDGVPLEAAHGGGDDAAPDSDDQDEAAPIAGYDCAANSKPLTNAHGVKGATAATPSGAEAMLSTRPSMRPRRQALCKFVRVLAVAAVGGMILG
jgi:hypothetical protein